MKRLLAFAVFLVMIFSFSGCDYYSDERISVILPAPDSLGLVAYQAGVSTRKNGARIDLLRYELDAVQEGKIHLILPETIRDASGKEIEIDSFGGPIGTNAPIQKFSLVIEIQGSATAETVALTIDAGALPLDTSYWNDIELCFLADGTVMEIPLESVVFRSDEPLVYKLHLKEKGQNGAVSDATDSDKWY